MKEAPAPYVHQEFPKFKYSAEFPPRIVHDAATEEALGEGWFNSPVAVAPAPKKAKAAKL
jgi:hypothetical protein